MLVWSDWELGVQVTELEHAWRHWFCCELWARSSDNRWWAEGIEGGGA